jgi:L-fuculokinase
MMPVIAVYDIGKTNKKLLLFDTQYNVVREDQVQLPEGRDDEEFPCEDISLLCDWIRTTWNELQHVKEVNVRALHFSGYGASLVHIDQTGEPVTPLYSYFKPFPDEMKRELYDRYGGETVFASETASPPMGMLNSGLQLYWLKRTKPDCFSRIKWSLHLPQFCSYLFTHIPTNEYTSIGCHTALWDFEKKRYHRWVLDEGLDKIFPQIQNEGRAGETVFRGIPIPVGVGLHDSSAALIPYMSVWKTKFILLSTGTWCVNLNPFARTALHPEKMKRDCLAYMTFHGTPVIASRVLLGGEHDFQLKRLAEYFNQPLDTYMKLRVDREILLRLSYPSAETGKRLIPATMRGTGPFPHIVGSGWNLSAFGSYEEAYHQLVLDLACLVRASIDLIQDDESDDISYIIDGGFGNNRIFMTILASLLNGSLVQSSQIAQATALGSALLLHDQWEGEPGLDEKRFYLENYAALEDVYIREYYQRHYSVRT